MTRGRVGDGGWVMGVGSQVYRVIKGIESDTLGERHEPGAKVDLSRWPAEVVAAWVEQGVIEPIRGRGEVKRGPER